MEILLNKKDAEASFYNSYLVRDYRPQRSNLYKPLRSPDN